MRGLALAVVASLCIASVSLVVYVVFNYPTALLGVGVAGVVMLVVLLDLIVKAIQPPGEQINI